MKVVTNNCYGGFSLSERALKLLQQRKQEKGIDISNISVYLDDEISRHDPDLIYVVEHLGSERASGECAELIVEELYNHIYRIEEYDGLERIVYPDSEQDWCIVEPELRDS